MATETRSPSTFDGSTYFDSGDGASTRYNWTNPSNAGSSNNTYATVTISTGFDTSKYLTATNFGFTIPAGATIDGITVNVERKATAGTLQEQTIQLFKAGSAVGTKIFSNGVDIPTTDTVKTVGHDGTGGQQTSLWGTTWSASDINNSGFGVGYSFWNAVGGGSSSGSVDHIEIVVYYTGGSTQYNQAVSASSTATASLSSTKSFIKTLSASASAVASLAKQSVHSMVLATSSTGTAVFTRSLTLFRTLTATAAGTASLVAVTVARYVQTLSTTSTATASMLRTSVITVAINAVSRVWPLVITDRVNPPAPPVSARVELSDTDHRAD